jgi:hypothetical protein
MISKLCFCWGFFGATLPEIIRLQKIVTNPILKIDFFLYNISCSPSHFSVLQVCYRLLGNLKILTKRFGLVLLFR